MKNFSPKALAALLIAAAPAHAQVATDGSVGARVTLSGREIVIPDSLGLRAGTNLLHSFSTFNVAAGARATFTGVGFIQHIIARITGGSTSFIDGTVSSAIPGSSLYLVNPSGIVFGPTAAIDVPGSFHASTGHYVRLADGTRVPATATPDVTLTFAPPAAFGFEGASGAIALRGAQLRVREGQRISLAGGDVTLSAEAGRAALLFAPSGTVGIVASASAGEAVIEPGGLRAEGFGAMGRAAIRDSIVSVAEGGARRGAGAISIAAGELALVHATLNSVTSFGAGRGISLSATRAMTIDASEVLSVTRGAGDAGPLSLRARDITISNASLVDTSCDPGCTTGRGGRLTLHADGTLRIEGTDPVHQTFVVSNSFGAGRTGEIDVTAGRLEIHGNAALQGVATASGNGSSLVVRAGDIVLTGGGQIDGSVKGTGNGARVEVTAANIRIEGLRPNASPTPAPDDPAFFPSGIFAGALRGGNAGDIVISTRTLDIVGGGQVSSSAGRLGVTASGSGGTVTVNASERIRLEGFATSPAIDASGIYANTFGAGEGGSIALSSPRIDVLGGARVQTQSEGGGRSGPIRIAGGDLNIAGGGQVASSAFRSGDGGTVNVELTGTLSITGASSGIYAQANGEGNGGDIDIAARAVVMQDFGAISAQTRSTAPVAGRGGNVRIRVSDRLAMSGGAKVSAETFSAGDGGSLDIRSEGTIELVDGAEIITTSTQPGDAGTIRVEAREAIAVSRGARIASESLGSGLAGRIEVLSSGLLTLTDDGRITTAARSSDGGDIFIAAGTALLDRSRVTTEVGTGEGGGGNMEIQVPILVMRDALVTANAFGGPGGNIHIATSTFIPSANSRVTASSELGVDGTITIDSPAIDPTGELLVPAPAFLDAGAILAGRCGPRLAGRASSLVVVPRAGLAQAPDGWRAAAAPSPAPWAQPLACLVNVASLS